MTRITSAIVFSAWALFMALTASAAFAAWDVDSMNIQIDQTSVVVNEGCSGTLIDLDERVESDDEGHEDAGKERCLSTCWTRCSQVTNSASPASSCCARRSVSTDQSRSISASSTSAPWSASRLASKLEATIARSCAGSVRASSSKLSAVFATLAWYRDADSVERRCRRRLALRNDEGITEVARHEVRSHGCATRKARSEFPEVAGVRDGAIA